MKPPDQHSAAPKVVTLIARELEDRTDSVIGDYHVIDHPFYGWVQAQVFNFHGEIIPTPGSSRAWRQRQADDFYSATVLVDRLSSTYYPVTVVIIGCELFPDLSSV